MDGENLAAIDLGTNSCRLRITDKNGNLIYREAVTTKLGEGLVQNMCFTPQAIERGLNCLTHFAELMHKYKVGSYIAITTASCRMASNGAEFVQKVKDTCGIELQIVSAEEEAKWVLKGAILNADKNKQYVVVYDLGGGSTEISLATNEQKPQVLYTISIPWGARNSSEIFDLAVYNQENAQKLEAEIKKYVDDFIVKSDFANYKDKCCFIATSSTPLRLVSMVKNVGVYDRDFADGLSVETNKIDEIINQIYAFLPEQIAQSPYIGENRATIFVAACVIFQTIYKTLQIEKLTASLKGAQEAIIKELQAHG